MDAAELNLRAKKAALDVIGFIDMQEKTKPSRDVIHRQLLRSATSVASNYRAACRAKSQKDFVYKLSVIVDESDETVFWLELLNEAKLAPSERVSPLLDEYTQLLKIFSASHKTARCSLREKTSKHR